MEILHLPTDAESVRNNALLSSNFYEDSIHSFAEVLAAGPPESLFPVCDTLIQAGLSNKETAMQYRNMMRSNSKSKEMQHELETEKKRMRKHKRQYETTQSSLQTLNDDFNGQLKDDEQKKQTILAKTMESLTSMFHQPFQQQQQPKPATEKEDSKDETDHWMQTKMLQETIQRTTEQLARHQAAIDASESKIEMLQREIDSVSTPIAANIVQDIESAIQGAMPHVCWEYAQHIKSRHFKLLEQYQTLDAKTDLTRPHEWFLHARLDRRKIIYHGGPTNSGKTHAALERLKAAKTGIYYGPLRLLAAEVYEKLTVAGIYCNLITGQEKRIVPFATHGSATVEMAVSASEQSHDVVVIDEIQMIADDERGFAWTRALLGTRCKEIHVCGGLEAIDVVRKIANACNDEFELHTYRRFSELQIADSSLATQCDQAGSYRYVQPGDCVVAFSRNDIFAIQREIESTTNYKCCVVYGSLPPQTRSEQARRFNDPDSGYDILVASDAIGMGLNLNIRRIIFNSVYKNDGKQIIRLNHSAMKQISGRAGRRNSPFPIGGELHRFEARKCNRTHTSTEYKRRSQTILLF
jgi:ATP-dependent RNA helicase SUPV3L1/SUV3